MHRRQLAADMVLSLWLCATVGSAALAEEKAKTHSPFADLTFSSYSFRGAGHQGPYLLPHAKIAPQSETIIVNWVPFTRGKDYTLDPTTAAITFARTLTHDDEVTVRYAHAKTAKKRKPTAITGDTQLYKSDTSGLKLVTGYQEDPKGKADPLGNYGLDASTAWIPHLQVKSTFLVSDRVERPGGAGMFSQNADSRAAGSASGEASADNAALDTTAILGGDRSRITAAFTRVGEDYRGVGKDGKKYKPGTKTHDIKATHMVSDNLSVRAGHAAAEKERDGATISDKETTTGGVHLKMGAKSDVDLSTTRVDAQGKPKTDTHRLASNVQATEQVSVGLAATRSEVDGGNRTDTRQISSKVRPNDKVTLDLSAGESEVNGEKTSKTHQVRSQLQPTDKVNVVATYREREQVKSQTDTRDVSLQASAGNSLKVKGSFSETESAKRDPTKAHAADVEYQPTKAIKVTGQVAKQTTGDGVRSATGGTLIARLRHDLHVQGTYTDRTSNGLPNLGDTRDFRLKFTPFEKLQLQAQLTERPAKKLWQPQQTEQKCLRVGSQLSPSVHVSGGYTTREWFTADRTTDVADMRLELGFFRRHSLYAGLSLSSDIHGSDDPFRQRLYSLGYAYQLGSRFSFSVDGTLTERDNSLGGSDLDDKPEYNVEGKLSAHF